MKKLISAVDAKIDPPITGQQTLAPPVKTPLTLSSFLVPRLPRKAHQEMSETFSYLVLPFCQLIFLLLISPAFKPFKCPLCRTSFEVPEGGLTDLLTNHFVSNALADTGPSRGQFDPNNVTCEGCEEIQATEYCKDCSLYFCPTCKKTHLKPRATAHHQLITVDESLKVGAEAIRSRVTRCHKHTHLEVNSYCGKCQESICPECVVDFHSGHPVERLVAVAAKLKGEISAAMNKVFPFFSSPFFTLLPPSIHPKKKIIIKKIRPNKTTETWPKPLLQLLGPSSRQTCRPRRLRSASTPPLTN